MNPLLDKYLCDKYPKIFADRYKPMTETCMCHGFSCKNGWFYLINSVCKNIQHNIDQHNKCVDDGYEWALKKGKIPQVVFDQVKEKFSGLRIYYHGGDEKIQGMVDAIEEISYSVCEVCGRMDHEVGRNCKGWTQTTCKNHAPSIEMDFKINDDAELTKIWEEIKESP